MEFGVLVDLIGGNSMGVLIGVQFVCGYLLEQIFEQMWCFVKGGECFIVLLVFIVVGCCVECDLQCMFGDLMIEQFWWFYFVVVCNFMCGCIIVQVQGLLWCVVFVSNLLVGLFLFVVIDGELMVDGVILENVLVQLMCLCLGMLFECWCGNGMVIVIDVDVFENLCVYLSFICVMLMSMFKCKFIVSVFVLLSIVGIFYSVGYVGSLNQWFCMIVQVDYYFELLVGNFLLMVYQSGVEIVEVGYCYVMEKIVIWDKQLKMVLVF